MDKLIRSVNALKFHYGGLVAEEKNQRDTAFNPKERQTHINSIAESLTSPSLKTSSDLPGLLTISIEILLQACTDDSADVRINADESLNKIIKCLHETAIGKILVELYKDIKKNGHSRSLRASLSRFASLCFNIRPSKGRAYILNLLPCLCRISQREEDYLQECLATSTCKIFSVLGVFVSEGEVQGLVASFLKNLSSKSLSIRRSAGTCLHAIIVNSRKRDPVLLPLLHSILDILVQRHTDRSTVLGCMQTLRLIVPLLQVERKPSVSNNLDHQAMLVQIFESSIYYICHKDHTVVTSALELLEQLLKSFPLQFAGILSTLFDAQSFVPSDIQATQDDSVSMATSSSSTSLTNLAAEEDQLLRENLASTITGNADSNLQINGAQPTQEVVSNQTQLGETSENKILPEQSPTKNGSTDTSSITEVSVVQNDQDDLPLALRFSDFFMSSAVEKKTDPTVLPLHLLGLMLCQRFLLTTHNGEPLQNRKVRVSMKNLALTCLAHLVNVSPAILCLQLYSNIIEETGDKGRPTMMKDVFTYCNHDDPQLRGAILSVASTFISSVVMKHRSGVSAWVETESKLHQFVTISSAPDIHELGAMMISALGDDSSGTARQACSAIAACLNTLLNSAHFQLGIEMVNGVLALRHNPYWLIQTDLLEIIATLNLRQLAHIEKLNESQNSAMLIKTLNIQETALSIALQCLESDDSRIRKVAAETLVGMVTNLSLLSDDVSMDAFVMCREQLGLLYFGSNANDEPAAEAEVGSVKNMLKTYRGYKSGNSEENITSSLMLIVQRISSILSTSTKKQSSFGCISALKLLTTRFPVCQYPEAWGCHFATSLDHDVRLRSGSNISTNDAADSDVRLQQLGILPLVMDLLKTNWLPLDITAHSECLILAGNLIAGAATHEYRVLGESASEATSPTDSRRSSSLSSVPAHNLAWSSIQDVKLSSYAQSLFVYLIKLLSVNHHVITETTPSSNKSVLPNLPSNPSLPSPIKRKDKTSKDQAGSGNQSKISPKPARKILPSSPLSNEANKGAVDADKEKSTKKTLGNFYQNRILMKLYEQLNGAYKNYKSSLEFGRGDRLVMFVDSVLDVTCQILELASFQDVANYTEEILSYLKSNFTLQANAAVLCTQQLLKALFGTNLVSQRAASDENTSGSKSSLISPRNNSSTDYKSSFYHQVFHHPLNHLTMSVANASFHNSLNSESSSKDGDGWFGSIKKKMEIKLSRASKLAKSNKSSIQNYIRLFEGLVIRSLTKYTVTSSVDFQKEVLSLLAQLVQLRVNYCMLDSDLVFITFIIKQFESIETAMIRDSEGLVPHVFFFLVLLSYECYQSKSVITMPKIIQLCDGLMASGLGAISHVIPALQPIVHDLFVLKSQSRQDVKEMTTQREVVQFTMIKLIQHPQVFGMLTAVLQHGRRENPKSWKDLSRQVTNVLLPHLNNLQIEINSQTDVSSLHSLFEAISPTSLRPCDVIVEYLFAAPPDTNKTSSVKRWIGKVLVLLRLLICHVSEEDLMTSIKNLLSEQMSNTKSMAVDENEDVQKSQSPESFAAKFFHTILSVSSEYLHQCSTSSIHFDRDSDVFICQEIAELLLSLTYIHRSGSFKQLTAACRQLAAGASSVTSQCQVETLHVTFAALSPDYPVLTLLWCQYLTHLDAVQLESWEKFIGSSSDDSRVISREIVRRGSLILLADYVCQNIQQADLMAWMVDNHISDVIELHREPPVQDLVTSVHRSTLAGKFVKSVAEIPKYNQRPSVLRNILRSLAGSTVTYTGELLEVLLCDRFLFSPFLAISQSCDRIACEHVERVLAHGNSDGQILSLERLDELLNRLTHDEMRRRRFGRLHNLLVKSRDQLTGESTRQPQSSPTVESLLTDPGKDWFKNFLIGCCQRDVWTPECARALSNCDYDDIEQVMRNEHFKLRYLAPCLSFGVRETLNLSSGTARYPDEQSSAIMKCASDVMASHLGDVAQSIDPLTDFRQPLEEHHLDVYRTEKTFALCTNLTLQLKYNQLLPSECQLDPASYKSCVKVAIRASQILYWQLHHGTSPYLCDVISCVEILQQLLKRDGVRLSIVDELPAVICVTQTLFHIVQHYIGELPLHKPFLPQSFTKQQAQELLSDAGSPLVTCVRLSQLVDLFRNSSGSSVSSVSLPGDLAGPIKNVVLHLSTSRHTNSYVRVPRLLWKFGWQPASTGEHETTFPDLPSEYLQEKDVLDDYLAIINNIGWTRRTQYEETWASLLGVLVSQPVVVDAEAETQNEDAIQLSCIAIRALTSLVINCSLLPHGGQTATGTFEVLHRHSPLKLAHTRPGRQLLRVRSILNEEIRALLAERNHMDTHHYYNFRHCDAANADWLEQNTERVLTSGTEYGVGQVSIRAFQQVYGIHPAIDDVPSVDSSDDDSSAVTSSGPDHSLVDGDESDASDVFEQQQRPETTGAVALSPLRVRDGVDVHSCVQFLLDLFTEWFRTAAQANQSQPGSGQAPPSPIARPILCESVRALLLISDLFTERQQFEWMYSALIQLHSVQPPEDEILLQYIVTSICKAGSVLGLSMDVSDVVVRALEPCFSCSSVSWHISALQGALYCLERSPNANLKPIVDLLAEFIPSKLVNATTSKSIYNEDFVIMLASVAFYVIEKCSEMIPSEFTSVIIQASTLLLSTPESTSSATPSRVYHAVTHGLERLVLAFALSSLECDAVLKVAAEQLQNNPHPARSSAACALMLTCMYCERMRTSPPEGGNASPELEDAVEIRLLAMERVSLLFERVRRGFARDARVMTRILPLLLDDFFPPQDVMNKVIAEFISTFQPFPDLIAEVVNQVFQALHNRDQSQIVQEWVMLSLGNVIQRTPLSTAVWCLTCLFACASTNPWINSLLPVISVRRNRVDPMRDWDFFCKTALDFYRFQLSEELDRRSFHATFSTAASSHAGDSPYKLLLDCIGRLSGESGILQ